MLLNCHQDLDTEMRLDLGALLQRDPSRIEAILDDSNRFEAAGSFGGFSTFLGSLMALKHEVCIYCIFYDVWISLTIQGGPSGRGTQFVDIKLKVLQQSELLVLSTTLTPMSTKCVPRPDGPPCSNTDKGQSRGHRRGHCGGRGRLVAAANPLAFAAEGRIAEVWVAIQ